MTINEIARLAGVSRGTVDRVIHNRGNVHPDIQLRIQKIISQTGFSPNLAASALRRSAQRIRIGIVIPALTNEFYKDVLDGVKGAAQHYAQYGVTIIVKTLAAMTVQNELDTLQKLYDEKVDGIAVVAIDDPEIRSCIEKIGAEIPVVTFNSDCPCSRRICFVGQNHLSAGRTAGNLLCSSLKKPGVIIPFVSYPNILAHTQRIQGLSSMLCSCPFKLTLLPAINTYESDKVAYDSVKQILQEQSDVACIYIAGGGQVGAADALAASGKSKDVMMICFDLLPKTIEHLKAGVVDYTIGQQPFLQGYIPIAILYQYIALNVRPQKEFYYTSIDIRVKENAAFDGIDYSIEQI